MNATAGKRPCQLSKPQCFVLAILPRPSSNRRSAPCRSSATGLAASTSHRESAIPIFPLPVADGAIDAIHAGHNIYTRLDGIATLRRSISEKLQQYNGITADPESQILVTNGATGALYASLLALLNPQDEVIVFEPFYGYHVSTLISLRIQPIIVPLAQPDWQLDVDALRQAITPRTRAIIVNTPSNPSGKVFTRAECEALAGIAIQHDLFRLHRRDLRILSLRRQSPHLARHSTRNGRAHDHDLRPFKDLQHHRMARRLPGRRRAVDLRHRLLPRPHLRLQPRSPAIRSSRRPSPTAELCLLQELSTEYQAQARPTLRRPRRFWPYPIHPWRSLLRPRRCLAHRGQHLSRESPYVYSRPPELQPSLALHSSPMAEAKTSFASASGRSLRIWIRPAQLCFYIDRATHAIYGILPQDS